MSRVLVYLGRFALIIAGYAVASFTAGAFLTVLLHGSIGLARDDSAGVLAGPVVYTIPVLAVFVAYFAFFPSIAVIIAAEVLGRRDWLYYTLAGAAVSLIMIVILFGADPGRNGSAVFAGPAATIVGAGIVAGAAYWLVAGRLAGDWMESIEPPTWPGPSGS
ncbi:MAG TPA: hypothetical protein GX405_01635 [Rhizobiales bacterium]|nr:hypothetical protein [Hyphomicrobiales bacterium]